jgi:hypothetical protein
VDIHIVLYLPKCVEVDFSHLETKRVGYARHRSRLKEVIELHTLPPKMVQVLASFAPLFSMRVFQHAQLLLVGRSSQGAYGRDRFSDGRGVLHRLAAEPVR